ncbi:MAG: PHP domain-containing protein [Salinibacter sp.]
MPDETIYADLHTHTHCSDGRLAPSTLVQRAAERGVEVLAVTDHDTTEGLEAARTAAEDCGVRLVNGVELSVEVDERSVHLLGYGFDPGHPALTDYLSAFSRRRRERLDWMIRRLSESGVDVSTEAVARQVETSAAPGRPHLARAMVAEGHVDDYKAAFEQYLGTDQPAYVPAPTQPAAAAIDALHTADGVAVLAHPGQWTPGTVLRTLREQGLDGIECFFPSHPDYLVDYYKSICRSHDLLVTGGSDTHGRTNAEERPLGAVGLTKAQWERFRDSAL